MKLRFKNGIRHFAALALISFGIPLLSQSAAKQQVWIATWGSSQQIPELPNLLPAGALRDTTIRQVFHVSIGGSILRVHISNAFGEAPLHITSVHVAKPFPAASADINPTTDRALTFAGSQGLIVPAGAEFVSDPVEFPLAALADVAVSYHVDAVPAQQTGHPGSRATSYYVQGDKVAAANLPEAARIDHWYQISEIDVASNQGGGSVVALGDSITDGHGATTNGNNRWTDVLAARLSQSCSTRNIGVSNQGIGGNHLLTDGLGQNALARFDRDVLAPAGVRWVIVLEGVNDLGGLTRNGEVPAAEHAMLVQRILAAYEQIITRAHAHGIQVYGATITPFVGSDYYHPGPQSEADRQQVNQWIRAAGHFDAVIDFDAAVRDPQHPERLRAEYDCGDHLHPSPAGYRGMGEAVPLTLFLWSRPPLCSADVTPKK